ncbi:toprim domain-containing protein [Streptomyces eurocidicus]|uniref:Topoisomerase n=1 Tax=Streptomyces eurocidicus TaxID=66423 RepID=A0A7W8BGU7_STREU|nr:toprim domain-containing protein [Streptomyces eurocidicus]MBB5123201.1 hypothetical protein [Streptomyces eurocidicus]
MRRSDSHKADLVKAAKIYQSSYRGSPAEEYLCHRGLGEAAERFKIGFVSDPLPGHDAYRGRLAIPYLRPAASLDGVATIRFRCINEVCTKHPDGTWREDEHHAEHTKYLGLPGDPPMLFHTEALIEPSPYIGLAEGEFDTMASVLAGVPASGIPGVSSWRDYFAPAFAGFETVFTLGDGDEAGIKFTATMAERLTNSKPSAMPPKLDVNKFILQNGADAYRKRLGV